MKLAIASTLFATTAALSSSSFAGQRMSTGVSSGSATTTMKIYDWKRRSADESALNDVENSVFELGNLRPAPGSKHRKSRKGRGISAGQGATCGFGMRGQKARAGRPTRPGFEGGQQPLYRRLPKFVGKPTRPGHSKTEYNVIKLSELNGAAEGSTVNFESLFEANAITKSKESIHKIVSGGDFTAKGITVQAHAFTKSAREAIEGAGGKCELLKRTTGEVLVEA